jgi:hypothetical protein
VAVIAGSGGSNKSATIDNTGRGSPGASLRAG